MEAPASSPRGPAWRSWLRAVRLHHWSKNLLVFAPAVLAHEWASGALLLQLAIGFFLLGSVSSAGYLLNDLADLEADRQHPDKRDRPLASGAIAPAHARIVALILLPAGLVGGLLLDPAFGAALLAYAIITITYSLTLRRIPLLDLFAIALLFTLRLVMGGALSGHAISVWLLTFSMFFFFSLATAKRHAELARKAQAPGLPIASRGYVAGDWPLTLALGTASAVGSLIIFVLYLVEEAFAVAGYGRPAFLWGVIALVAIWIGRIWLLAHRGALLGDPVAFALTDRWSWGLAILLAATFLVAL